MLCKIHWSNVFFIFDVSSLDQNITYFVFSKIRIIVIFAASITSAPLTCLFDALGNLISSSISIGFLNKHRLAELLLTACNYYQL